MGPVGLTDWLAPPTLDVTTQFDCAQVLAISGDFRWFLTYALIFLQIKKRFNSLDNGCCSFDIPEFITRQAMLARETDH